MAKVGRPSEYTHELCVELLSLMSEGKKDCEIYAKWGITRDTFYRWKREHPEFKITHERGLELCESYWEDIGRKGMLKEKNIDFKFWIAFMNRKFGWSNPDKGSTTHNTQINIGNVNILEDSTKDQLIDFITNSLKSSKVLELTEVPEDAETTQNENNSNALPNSSPNSN
jgi:hypothetical protein